MDAGDQLIMYDDDMLLYTNVSKVNNTTCSFESNNKQPPVQPREGYLTFASYTPRLQNFTIQPHCSVPKVLVLLVGSETNPPIVYSGGKRGNHRNLILDSLLFFNF